MHREVVHLNTDEERRAVNPNKTQTRVLRLWKTIAINFSIRLNYKTIYTLESNKSKVVSFMFLEAYIQFL